MTTAGSVKWRFSPGAAGYAKNAAAINTGATTTNAEPSNCKPLRQPRPR